MVAYKSGVRMIRRELFGCKEVLEKVQTKRRMERAVLGYPLQSSGQGVQQSTRHIS